MHETTRDGGQPSVVLVHGAFADSSSWNDVIERIQAKGVKVTTTAVPLRGRASDSAYVAVGHSYGGAVITNAAGRAKNVVALVFVSGFAPDVGERLGEVEALSRDSVLMSALVPQRYPAADGGEPAIEFVIDPAQFHDAFAADLPVQQTAVMAATQRPAAETSFSEPTVDAAWKDLPCWAVVASGDRAAGADVVRSMAQRGARITEIDGSHVR